MSEHRGGKRTVGIVTGGYERAGGRMTTGTGEVETTEPTTVKEKIFRLRPEEDARLPKMIEYAYKAGYIAKPSFQEFMLFSLNCAFTRLKDDYEVRKGRR